MGRKKENPKPEPIRFLARCPFDHCGHTLFPVRIQTVPLGVVVLVCFNCNYVYLSEPADETTGYVQIAKLSNGLPNLFKTVAAYEDALGLIAPFLEWLKIMGTDRTLNEASLHRFGSLYVFLQNIADDLEQSREFVQNYLDGKNLHP